MNILSVAKPVGYAMAVLIGLTCLFLAINLAVLVFYRHHKVYIYIPPPDHSNHFEPPTHNTTT